MRLNFVLVTMAWVAALTTLAGCQTSNSVNPSNVASNNQPRDPKADFLASTEVQAAISAKSAASFTTQLAPVEIFIGGGCGFAGCDESVLVVQPLKTGGSNTRSTHVMAVVSIPAQGTSTVTLAEVQAARAKETVITSTRQPEDAFKLSASVQKALAAEKSAGFTKEGPISAVTISGGCGFAGCDASVLVIQLLSTMGSNTRTASVAAVIDVPAVHSDPNLQVSLAKIVTTGQ